MNKTLGFGKYGKYWHQHIKCGVSCAFARINYEEHKQYTSYYCVHNAQNDTGPEKKTAFNRKMESLYNY